ncbi:DUF3109 family protein [Prosthecochloris sp. HL-130-GSB]|jgi:hypothetical protein|uniref:DUF3109 family protein n=1 Tax=Prosthecochloris aestuarii TaxID=1102 RepID=A0A831SSN7_PROAE|nr:DUF3109 family protein [Prosthecochloris sp. HL-130-GSB]ARM30881.1 hypothetical protein B9H02_05660 [Prosthecochloris sp. HL-130-GSB]MBO8092616.1 DUF3109 family protein [Prosthecochloris sp.]HED31383.1 DUF3109 family protein [Prosthecochloris aestuarii]
MGILSVDNVLVDSEVALSCFTCNLQRCHGACCVNGELGAPLTAVEASRLENIAGLVRDLLPEKNRRYIDRSGVTELYRGDHYTKTIDGGACVFTSWQGDIAFCALEQAVLQGISDAFKPVSCRLFPVRVRKKFGLDYLVYEQHHMCRHARKEGTEKGVLLVDFLKDVLVERYGTAFYSRLKDFSA